MMGVRRHLPIIALALALSGCATETSRPSPNVGTGWSRAPDLSVYGALQAASEIAREQEILCRGRSPAAVQARWRAEFGAREEWIDAAMAERYGADAVARVQAPELGREPCPTIANDRWRRSYARLLRLLELRLYPADYWSTL